MHRRRRQWGADVPTTVDYSVQLGVQCYDELIYDERAFYGFLVSDKYKALAIVLCSACTPVFELMSASSQPRV